MNDLERLELELEAPINGLLDTSLPVPNNARLLEIERVIVPDKGLKKRQLLWVALLLGLSGLVAAYMIVGQSGKTPEPAPVKQENAVKKEINKNDELGSKKYDNRHEGSRSTIYQQEVYGNE